MEDLRLDCGDLLRVPCLLELRLVFGEELPPGSPFTDQVELEKPSLPDGTAVGDITSYSAELWLKTQGPKHVQVEWASVEAWKRISAMASVQSPAARTPPVLTGPETDFTLTVSLEHLSPGTRYRYYVLVKDPDQREKASRPHAVAQGEFTTPPDPAASVPVTFAWSGDLGGQERCRQGEAGYPIFDTIRGQGLIFSFFSAIPSIATAFACHRRMSPGRILSPPRWQSIVPSIITRGELPRCDGCWTRCRCMSPGTITK